MKTNVELSVDDLKEIIGWWFIADGEGARPDPFLMAQFKTALDKASEPKYCKCGHKDSHPEVYSYCTAGTFCRCQKFRETQSNMTGADTGMYGGYDK